MTDICILTPHPDYEENWHPYADQYRALFGDQLQFRPWTDAGDLTGFTLVLPLLAWGYQRRPDAWFGALDRWEAQGVRMANSVSLLRWNTDKAYLLNLAERGVSVVPTRAAPALSTADMAAARTAFESDTLVIKPTISGGADGTYLLEAGDPIPVDVQQRDMLIQPMMPTIATEGEFSLFYFEGQFSHAILKTPASGDFRVQEQFGGRETAVTPPEAALTLAAATLAAAPDAPLFARVDMVRASAEGFNLMELEVIEPSLFFSFAQDGGQAFARSVRRVLGS
jgi:glutathione synthase/RimK-type ligase-like ATP-grasp enzyme